jgi:HK97 family phage prohead protease
MPDSYDFSGIATAYDVLCQDGRVIKNGAFNHQEGQVIPVVWRHGHDDIRNVVGHASLSVNAKPPGMRVKSVFNDTDEGRRAKLLVHNKDIRHLSIWANQLKELRVGETREVETGTIREVSLVLAGKNPGAYIDDVVRHSDDPLDPDSIIEDGIIKRKKRKKRKKS